MRNFSLAVSLALAASLLCGCASVHSNIHDDSLDYFHFEPGHMEYHLKSGKIEHEYFPKESPVDIKDGVPKTYNIGVPRELEVGWDVFALTPRPFVGIRCFYLGDFGGMIGADENAFLLSLDWRYKDVLCGPCIGSPWLNSQAIIWGGKVALPLAW